MRTQSPIFNSEESKPKSIFLRTFCNSTIAKFESKIFIILATIDKHTPSIGTISIIFYTIFNIQMENSFLFNWQINIQGIVQGVGFRPFIKRLADEYDLKGLVKNLGNKGVLIEIYHQSESNINIFLNQIQKLKPKLSEILEIQVAKFNHELKNYNDFYIEKSSLSVNGNGFIALPTDTGFCRECLYDFLSQNNRKKYEFVSCTNCGPRYTIVSNLPYDRINTSFNSFSLCSNCEAEYFNTMNRRFHSEANSCINCGPKYDIYKKVDNKWIEIDLDWEEISSLLESGKIFAMKGIGGTHLIFSPFNTKTVKKVRLNRRKSNNKPFAVMMKNIEYIKKYCFSSEIDEQILQSPKRPIVILEAKDASLWADIAPNLNTLGVILPYSTAQLNLFGDKNDVLVFTSANIPNFPMPISNKEIFDYCLNIADFLLIHNLNIIQRVDDSVLRSHDDYHLIIRRARGYVPRPFYYNKFNKLGIAEILSLGAEENATITLHKNGWFTPSQHLGNITTIEAFENLKNVRSHLEKLFSIEPKYVTSDLNPIFLTTNYKNNLALEGFETLGVQHHVSHLYSLTLDHNMDIEEPFAAWVCDGFGYGVDGKAWGCEFIEMDNNKPYWRKLATAVDLPYMGRDQDAKYPARMLLNLCKLLDIEIDDIFNDLNIEKIFLHGKKEFDFIKGQKFYSNYYSTSALGRFLDINAILLGYVDNRSYRGEPAITLEANALKSKIGSDEFYITSQNGMLKLDYFEIFEKALTFSKEDKKPNNIAKWILEVIANSLSKIAIYICEEKAIKKIGLTGGVFYNKIITTKIISNLKKAKLNPIIHKNIPPGDGGISLGQAIYHGRMLYE